MFNENQRIRKASEKILASQIDFISCKICSAAKRGLFKTNFKLENLNISLQSQKENIDEKMVREAVIYQFNELFKNLGYKSTVKVPEENNSFNLENYDELFVSLDWES